MGLGFCIILSALLIFRLDRIVLVGWYCWIVSARLVGLDQLDWIGLYRLDKDTSAFMHWLVTARMGRMGRVDWMGRWWDWGGTDGR